MKRIILAVLAISAICFAEPPEIPSEKCNPNYTNSPEHGDPSLPEGWCYDYGYVCQVSTEFTGGVRFILGKDANCQTVKYTNFKTHPVNSDGSINEDIPLYTLMPYLQEGSVDNVSGLSVALNTAFLINASNEKFRVRITYHQVRGDRTVNSVRLLGITRDQIPIQ